MFVFVYKSAFKSHRFNHKLCYRARRGSIMALQELDKYGSLFFKKSLCVKEKFDIAMGEILVGMPYVCTYVSCIYVVVLSNVPTLVRSANADSIRKHVGIYSSLSIHRGPRICVLTTLKFIKYSARPNKINDGKRNFYQKILQIMYKF